MCDKSRKYEQLKMQFYLDCVDFDKPDNKPYIYIYIQIPSMLLMLKIIIFIMKNTHEKS